MNAFQYLDNTRAHLVRTEYYKNSERDMQDSLSGMLHCKKISSNFNFIMSYPVPITITCHMHQTILL